MKGCAAISISILMALTNERLERLEQPDRAGRESRPFDRQLIALHKAADRLWTEIDVVTWRGAGRLLNHSEFMKCHAIFERLGLGLGLEPASSGASCDNLMVIKFLQFFGLEIVWH